MSTETVLQLKKKSKTDIQKNKYKGKAISFMAIFSLKIFPSQLLSTVCIWPFVHSGCITYAPLLFFVSIEIFLFTSLYNHPIELFSSPRGSDLLKAGYLSFQQMLHATHHPSPHISQGILHSHTHIQTIKQCTSSKGCGVYICAIKPQNSPKPRNVRVLAERYLTPPSK